MSPVVLPPSVAHNWRQRVGAVKDCLVCGREIHHPAKGFCAACWYPLYRQLATRMHRPVSAAEAAAMLLWDYWPIWEHYRRRAA